MPVYAKARADELQSFTGVDSPDQEPLDPALHLRTENQSVDAIAKRVVEFVDRVGVTTRFLRGRQLVTVSNKGGVLLADRAMYSLA